MARRCEEGRIRQFHDQRAENTEDRGRGKDPELFHAILSPSMVDRPNREGDLAQTLQLESPDESLRSSPREGRAKRPFVVVLRGNDVGLHAPVRRVFLIGRNEGADLTLTDPRISSFHARIEFASDGWWLIDLNSTNGTRVNGERVMRHPLSSQDKVEVGDTILRFELRDATDQAYDEHVRRMIDIDDLTGLSTRRRFEQLLADLVRDANRQREPMGLLVMDLDGLKEINDTHGHLCGAYVIAETGKVIGATLPANAVAARYGGDEYVAAVPGAGVEEASRAARSILEAIQTFCFEHDGNRFSAGISIGVAVTPDHGSEPVELFRAADLALYEAKRRGKNQICLQP